MPAFVMSKLSLLSLVPRLDVRRFPLTFLLAFLVAFFIWLILSEIKVCGLMQIFYSLSISRGLAKHASFRYVTSVELESISLLKWQSLLQMPWLVVIWTIVTLCSDVCPVSISTNFKVFRTPLLILLQIIEGMLMLHPFYRNSTGCLLSIVVFSNPQHLCINFLHSGSPSYFELFLSFSSCLYSTRHSHPDCQYLTVPPFHSSVFKSAKHFGHSFAFDAPKIWNDLPQDVRSATSVASFRKKLKTYLFAKAYPP